MSIWFHQLLHSDIATHLMILTFNFTHQVAAAVFGKYDTASGRTKQN